MAEQGKLEAIVYTGVGFSPSRSEIEEFLSLDCDFASAASQILVIPGQVSSSDPDPINPGTQVAIMMKAQRVLGHSIDTDKVTYTKR